MRKTLALLRDSVREAIDGKVFWLLIGVSLLGVLFVAGLSFRPAPPEEGLRAMTQQLGVIIPEGTGRIEVLLIKTDIKDLEVVKESPDPASATYRFTLTLRDGTVLGAEGVSIPTGDGDEKPKPRKGNFFSNDLLQKAPAIWKGGNADPSEAEIKAIGQPEFEEFVRHQLGVMAGIEIDQLDVVKWSPTSAELTIEGGAGGERRAWPYRIGVLFGAIDIKTAIPLGTALNGVEAALVTGIGSWVILLFGVIVSSNFVPNMLRKGSVDLLLCKPVSRWRLLICKYLGGLAFVAVATAIAVGGGWLAMGLRTGVWSPGLLLAILTITYYFAILYALSTLLAVWSRSSVVAMLGTLGFWFVLWLLGTVHTLVGVANSGAFGPAKPSPAFVRVMDFVNAATPRTKDLDNLTAKVIADDVMTEGQRRMPPNGSLSYPPWDEVLGVSGAYLGLFLGLACVRFSRKDY